MNPTEFWFKIVDMTKSDSAVFSIAGRAITERQLIWVIGLSALVVLLLLIRWAIMWVMGSSPKPISEVEEPNPKTVQNESAVGATTPSTPPIAGTPQELLSDTSDRKRSLHDYVTPDTIHADVMKQTLNNDYPYQTLKPDPSKISIATPVVPPTTPPPVQPNVVATTTTTVSVPPPEVTPEAHGALFGTPAPVLPPLPVTNPVVATAPSPVSPIITTPIPIPTTVVPEPTVPVVPVQEPQPIPLPVTPTVAPAIPSPVQVNTPQFPAMVASSPETAPVVPVVPTTPSSVLPPLPPKAPTPTMVVGVANDETTPASPSKGFNPTDPMLP